MTQIYLPYDKLIAFQVAKRLLAAVVASRITDGELKDQATRAAKGAALNTAEASGRVATKDRQRVFGIARGECVECAAAVEIAAAMGACSEQAAQEVKALAVELNRILSALCR